MPSEHEHAPVSSDTEVIYGGRSGEDAFDYPSPFSAHSWSTEEETDRTGQARDDADPESSPKARGGKRPPSKEGGWQQAAERRRTVLMAAAALILVGGFGLALSTVSDTVTSNPHPGGTARVSAPKSPAPPSLPSSATTSDEPPIDAVSPAVTPPQTAPSPGADDHRGDDDAKEDPGREDDDHAED
ncbi:hypothetical protein OHB54_06020 [Streptomyces sp. NBC_01007]|nr:hypothetical protein OHB54_06020 [Streptomyces sp. NBC_01007]